MASKSHITGTTPHASELADHLKAKGLTMAGFLRVYNVRIRGGDVEVFHHYEELRRMMARRERAEGADDEGGEVGQNKVYSVGLGDLVKPWTEKAEHRRQEPHDRHAEQQLQQAADMRQEK